LHVLGPDGAPAADGEPGELGVAGAVARGYRGRAELTAERFVPEPGTTDGSAMYLTGDLVRRRADGEVDFLGRSDDQVKIHGVRVELGEIECALLEHPDVAAAAVRVRGDGALERELVAEVEPLGELDPADVRTFLAGR